MNQPSPELIAFLYGLLGSATLELSLLYRAYGRNARNLPTRYKSWGFWVVRLLLAVGSGGVATAYCMPGQAPFLYIHVGAATPMLLMHFSSTLPSPEADRREEPDENE